MGGASLAGVSKGPLSRYIHTYKKLPILVDFIKNWVHFIKNSDVISLAIDQSQPGVFYLQKMMNFMKPGVLYLQKMMNFMKTRTFYKKLPLFIKNSILHTYKKTQTSNMSFIKNSIFGTFRDPSDPMSQFYVDQAEAGE